MRSILLKIMPLLRSAALLALVLLPLIGLGLRGRIESAVAVWIGRAAAREALTAWGLDPNPGNVDLYLAAAREAPWNSAASPLDWTAPGVPPPADRRFSTRWTHGQLHDDGPVVIGIFGVDPTSDRRLDGIARAAAAATNSPVALRWLRSRDDLLNSFAKDDIVLYFGHANDGRGIVFSRSGDEPPLWMGRDILDVPREHVLPDDVVLGDSGAGFVRIRGGSPGLDGLDVRCKVFAYLGCRSDRYFRDTWQTRFPATDFIGTTYACNTSALASGILAAFVQGLREGRSLADIVAAMNQDRAADLLFGRLKETAKYRNSADHPDTLFVAH